MRNFTPLLASLLISLAGYGQTYNMTCGGTTTVDDCSGTVFDDGGTGNYSNGCGHSYFVIAPGTGSISLSFSSFNLRR